MATVSLPSPPVSLLLLAFLLLLLPTTVNAATPSRFHAARCLNQSKACSRYTARQTLGNCLPSIDSKKQPFRCRRLACRWCALPARKRSKVCVTSPLVWMCRRLNGGGGGPAMTTAPPTSPSPSTFPPPTRRPMTTVPSTTTTTAPPTVTGTPLPPIRSCPRTINYVSNRCVWRPNAKGTEIVIDLGRTRPPTGWTCLRRGNLLGWIYERNKNLGIDWKGARGRMCFRILPKLSGNYYFSALSYAPHNTEHNDMWVNSPDKGFELWQFGRYWRNAGTNEWLKAYQNNGVKGLIDQLKTKDFDGHRFVVPNVKQNEVFRVCISGRSYRYEVYKLFVFKCFGNNCRGVPLHGLQNRKSTQCKPL